jgi:CDP-glucose 4,6-dehydratase
MKTLFGGIYDGLPVVVTGHTGFKGSWLSLWLERLGARVTGYARRPHTEPNHFGLLDLSADSEIGELLDLGHLCDTVAKASPRIIFHLAAQPLVRDSYTNPVETYGTNVMGTLNVLEAARRCGSVRAVVAITTDKVYHNNEWEWGYRETDRLGGYDPYSASKACAETLLASYRDSFWNLRDHGASHNTLLASVRAGNVIGGGDWSKDRLIPDIMKACAAGEAVRIRNPGAIRPWQHVLECLSGYLMVGRRLLEEDLSFADAFNFGPADTDALSVGEIADMVKRRWYTARFTFPEGQTGPHEARFLKLDCSRARARLGWKPVWSVDQAVERTVVWYRDYYEEGRVQSEEDLAHYITEAASRGVPWAA